MYPQKYNIKNLNCAGCANKIQFELKKLKEIKDVNLNFYAKTLTFNYVFEHCENTMERKCALPTIQYIFGDEG